jgi:hypothetical protein
LIYKVTNFPNSPLAPLFGKKERGSLRQEIYYVFQENILFYEAPLFFIKERSAAVAGGECEKFLMKIYPVTAPVISYPLAPESDFYCNISVKKKSYTNQLIIKFI